MRDITMRLAASDREYVALLERRVTGLERALRGVMCDMDAYAKLIESIGSSDDRQSIAAALRGVEDDASRALVGGAPEATR